MISKRVSRELFVDRNDLSGNILLRIWLIKCRYFRYLRFVHAAPNPIGLGATPAFRVCLAVFC